MEKQLEKPLRTAIAFLEEQNYRYAVIGGMALAQWGVVRASRNVDIKVLVPILTMLGSATFCTRSFPIVRANMLQ